MVYIARHNEVPKFLRELLHGLSDMQNRKLRNSKTDLHIPPFKDILGTKELCLEGSMHVEQPCIRNKTSKSLSAFKAKLKALQFASKEKSDLLEFVSRARLFRVHNTR